MELKPITTLVGLSSSPCIRLLTFPLIGLILELFPSISNAAFVVRAITARSTALATKLQAEFPMVKVEVAVADSTSTLVQTADIICL